MPIWIAALRQLRDHARTYPRTEHRGADHHDQRQWIDGDGGDEDERLRDRRQRVAGVQRAWNAFDPARASAA